MTNKFSLSLSLVEGGSKDGEVISSSCLYSRLVHRDHSSVGMSHKTSVGSVSMTNSVDSREGISVHSTVGDRSSNNRSSSSVSRSLSSKVISTGSSHSRLAHRDHSSIRMGDQMSVQVEGSRVSITISVSMVGRSSSIASMGDRSSDGRNSSSIASVSDRSGDGRNSSSIGRSLSSKVISTSSSHSRLVSRDHSSIRMGNQVSVQVEGSKVSVASSVSMVGRSNHTNRSSGIDSTMSYRSGNGGTYSVSNTTKLQGEMVSTSCCYSRFIYWDHSTIRVTDQAMETVGHREGKRGENQELHDRFSCVLQLKLPC